MTDDGAGSVSNTSSRDRHDMNTSSTTGFPAGEWQ